MPFSFIVQALRRHRCKSALIWLTILAVGGGVAFLSPNVYQSEARLFVRLGRENVSLDATATIGQGPLSAMPISREGEINSVVEILKGRVLVEGLVDALTPEAILADHSSLSEIVIPQFGEPSSPRDLAIRKLSRKLDAIALRKSNLIAVSCDMHDPELARIAVDKYIELFLDQYRGLYRNPKAHHFFNDQAELLATQLQQTEAELLALKKEAGIGVVEEQRRILQAQIGAFEDDIQKVKTQIQAVEAQVATLEEKLSTLPKTVITAQTSGFPNVAADTMRQQLYILQLKEQELAANMTDDHVQLKQVRDQLKAAQSILQEEEGPRTQVTDSIGRAYEQVHLSLVMEEGNLPFHRARLQALEPQLAAARQRLTALNEAEIQVDRLQRQFDLQRSNYTKYADSLEQVRIDRALEMERFSNISIVQPATREFKPIKPNRPLYLMLAFCFATFAAIGLPLSIESLGSAPALSHDSAMGLNAPAPSAFSPRREKAALHANGNGEGNGSH